MATHHIVNRQESNFEVTKLRTDLETYNEVIEKERDFLKLTLKMLGTILVKLDNREDDPAFLILKFTKETKAKLEDILRDRSDVEQILYTKWKISPEKIADTCGLSDDGLQNHIEHIQHQTSLPPLFTKDQEAERIRAIRDQLYEAEMNKAIETLASLEEDLEDKNRELKEKYASLARNFNKLKKVLQNLSSALPEL